MFPPDDLKRTVSAGGAFPGIHDGIFITILVRWRSGNNPIEYHLLKRRTGTCSSLDLIIIEFILLIYI